jgi:hypothetical protein
MKTTTLQFLSKGNFASRPATLWYLAGLGEFFGKQAYYTRQSPQRLGAHTDKQGFQVAYPNLPMDTFGIGILLPE